MMRTLVCFGHHERGGAGAIEVSPTDMTINNLIMCRETLPTIFYKEDRNGNRPKEEIRLFHSQPLIVEDEEEDYDDEILFDKNYETTENDGKDESLSRDNDLNPMALTPRRSSRMPSQEVLAVIEDLENALDEQYEALSQASSRQAVDQQAVLEKALRPHPVVEKSDKAYHQPEVSLEKPCVKKSQSSKVTTSISRPKSAWTRFFSTGLRKKNKKKKKKASDQALLIPNNFKASSECFLFDDPDEDNKRVGVKLNEHTNAPGAKSSRQKKLGKLWTFLPRMFPIATKKPTTDDEAVLAPEIDLDRTHDQTRSISFGDDDAEDVDDTNSQARPQQTFRSDEEFIDHLVQVCDQNAPLEVEEGLNILQQRIHSKSRSNLSTPQRSKDHRQPQKPCPPIFSTSYLDMSPLVPPPSRNQSTMPSPAHPPVPLFPQDRNITMDSQTDSIPSISSIEDFLASVTDSDESAASLEAFLFEQELEKLTSEELAQLLDAEVEKLMREGLA